MMVAAVPLGHRRAAELRAEDDDRVVQHAALLEIDEQGRRAAIDFRRRPLDVSLERRRDGPSRGDRAE